MLEFKNFQRFSYPKDMDKEMIDFMDVLNNIPGCRTMYSCQGHKRGQWYFVANCCNETSLSAIRDYFENRQKAGKNIEIVEGRELGIISQIPEWKIVVYDKAFDQQTYAGKKAAYTDMCKYFLQFVPRKHWRMQFPPKTKNDIIEYVKGVK